MKQNIILKSILLLLIVPFNILFADSPPSLTTDVDLTTCNCTAFPGPDGYFNSNSQITLAFNFARRAEEVQFGLANGTLGNLVLPTNYNILADNQKAIFLLNSERAARAGVDYDGAGIKPPVLGLLISGVDANLNNLAQVHANYLRDNNLFTHNSPSGNAFQRIETQFGTQKEFLSRSENLYVSCGGFNTHLIEQAMFNWLYQDTSSSWGHRAALLIQNIDPVSGQNGFDDNFGSSGDEGYIGFGILRDIAFPLVCGSARLSAEPIKNQDGSIQNPNLTGNLVVFMVLDPSLSFQTTLPVNLLYFNVSKIFDHTVKLEWATTGEINNSGFVVEKSNDGQKFKSVGFLNAVVSKAELNKYSFTDEDYLSEIVYYRLKQIDNNGKFEYSKIKSINFENNKDVEMSMFPNPATTQINLSKVPIGSKIELFNLSGKIVYSEINNSQIIPINVEKLIDGLYFVKITKDNQRFYKKILISK